MFAIPGNNHSRASQSHVSIQLSNGETLKLSASSQESSITLSSSAMNIIITDISTNVMVYHSQASSGMDILNYIFSSVPSAMGSRISITTPPLIESMQQKQQYPIFLGVSQIPSADQHPCVLSDVPYSILFTVTSALRNCPNVTHVESFDCFRTLLDFFVSIFPVEFILCAVSKIVNEPEKFHLADNIDNNAVRLSMKSFNGLLDMQIASSKYTLLNQDSIFKLPGSFGLLNDTRSPSIVSETMFATIARSMNFHLFVPAASVSVLSDPKSGKKTVLRGGMVIEPTTVAPRALDDIVVYDVSSMYPSIAMEYNICPSRLKLPAAAVSSLESFQDFLTLLGSDESNIAFEYVSTGFYNPANHVNGKETLSPSSSISVATNSESFISSVPCPLVFALKHLQTLRERCTKLDNITHASRIKLIANALIGSFGNRSSSLYLPHLSQLITCLGRTLLRHIRDIVFANHGIVVYGDSDSVFVRLPKSGTDLIQCAREFRNTIVRDLRLKYGYNSNNNGHRKFISGRLRREEDPVNISIRLDDVFQRIIFFGKKRYVAISQNSIGDSFIEKGVDSVRHDVDVGTKDILRKFFLEALSASSSVKDIRAICDTLLDHVRQSPLPPEIKGARLSILQRVMGPWIPIESKKRELQSITTTTTTASTTSPLLLLEDDDDTEHRIKRIFAQLMPPTHDLPYADVSANETRMQARELSPGCVGGVYEDGVFRPLIMDIVAVTNLSTSSMPNATSPDMVITVLRRSLYGRIDLDRTFKCFAKK